MVHGGSCFVFKKTHVYRGYFRIMHIPKSHPEFLSPSWDFRIDKQSEYLDEFDSIFPVEFLK